MRIKKIATRKGFAPSRPTILGLLLATIAAMMLLLSACNSEVAILTPQTLDEVLDIANHRRQDIIRDQDIDRIHALIYGREAPGTDWPWLFDNPWVHFISRDYALEDTRLFFDLMRHYYGAYTYFGGDEVFLPILDNLLETIAQRDYMSASLLAGMIHSYLSPIVRDNHFWLYPNVFEARYLFFTCETPFDRTNNGFRHRDTGKYLAEIEGHDIDYALRLTVDESGRFFYTPVLVIPYQRRYIYLVQYTYTCGEYETARLLPTGVMPPSADTPPSLTFENGVPVVSLRRNMPNLIYTPFDGSQGYFPGEADLFLSFAHMLTDEPVIILDLRTNVGGFPTLAESWLYYLTGEIVPTSADFIGFQGMSPPEDMSLLPDDWYLWFNPTDTMDEFWEAYAERFGCHVPIDDYRSLAHNEIRLVPNDTLIILLVDRFSASAAEVFTSKILNMQNTLVIGQNTFGTLLTNSSLPLTLPNTGIPFIMGTSLVVHPYGTWQEGIGYAPDVWVIGDALAAALAMLEQ